MAVPKWINELIAFDTGYRIGTNRALSGTVYDEGITWSKLQYAQSVVAL